jgi:hypothetical protein
VSVSNKYDDALYEASWSLRKVREDYEAADAAYIKAYWSLVFAGRCIANGETDEEVIDAFVALNLMNIKDNIGDSIE